MRRLAPSDLDVLDGPDGLHGLAFDGLRLVGRDLSDRVVEDCSFRDCVLTDVGFNSSTIRRCTFEGASVQGASFFGASVEECKMMGLDFGRGVRFGASTFIRTNLDYCLLRGVDLVKVEFAECSMVECDFTGADLSQASLIGCDLTDADWSGVRARQTDLRGSRVRGFDLREGPYGVVLTSRQVAGLAGDLGITVIDPAEDDGR